MQGDRNDCRMAQRNLLTERFEQFSSVVFRLELERSQDTRLTIEIEELWKKRWKLIGEIVAAPAPTIDDAILKATIVSSLISNGELRIGITSRCFEDYNRAITTSSRTESELDEQWPALSSACRTIRAAITAASLQQHGLDDSWWKEFTTGLLAMTQYEAKTSAELRLKGEIFQEVLRFASEIDGLVELQMSYLRDFQSLAYHRSKRKSA
jgi:hypothetical protein